MKKILLFVFLFLFLSFSNLYAQEIATLESTQGIVEARYFPAKEWKDTQIGASFKSNDALQTGINSRAAVLFIDGILVRLNETTILEISAPNLAMKSGTAYFFSRQPRQFPVIETPTVSAAIRGTEFVVEADSDRSVISVLDGEVECSNAYGAVTAGSGEQAITEKGQAPVKAILVRPLDAVQWALYYPPILDISDVKAYPNELLHKSSVYLSTGQVKKAEAVLEEITSPRPSEYFSQKSIISIVNNRKEEALDFAKKAIEDNSNSASAALAMSYVQQSLFKLEDALHWTKQAVRLKPDNPFCLSRLAELELGFGHIKAAMDAIDKAISISPDDPHVLTVLGFTYLVQYETDKALDVLKKAISIDSARGTSHLGAGLSMIRQNKLREGRQEIELAAFLEPNVSLYRSYLGKAYYEERRDLTATHEYNIAKKLDPLDPTPYLYDAFYKLANTRPVEALWDIEDSINLNDNRAIYRSRLLLDQDQAVRSAGLSQVFTSIGFAEAGRIEAIKSINRDYSNYSSHLLLSGTYFENPTLNQASISEILITKLLSPLNFNPIEPTSRGDASFNEYTSLFDRLRMRLFLDSSYRSGDEYANGTVRQSGAFEKFFYIFRYFNEYTGGFRDNDWLKMDSLLLFTQHQLSYNDIFSFEAILGNAEEGDMSIGFDPWSEDTNLDIDLDNTIYRLGYHHKFGPSAHLIGQFMFIDRQLTAKDFFLRTFTIDTLIPGSITADYKQDQRLKGIRSDVQYLWDSSTVSLILGSGLYNAKMHESESSEGLVDLSTFGNRPEESIRFYGYTIWHLAEWLDVTLGANYTQLKLADITVPPPFSDRTREIDKFNPKTGITLYLTPNTTLRAAYFKTLGPAGFFDLEYIEPTLVAGFNQLTDDLPGTNSEVAGIGIDQKFSKWTYAGIEARRRKASTELGIADTILNTDLSSEADSTSILKLETEENQIIAYFNQVLNKTLTGTLDYTLTQPEDESTHRIKLGLNYFHPKGFFARTSTTWRFQDMDSERDFWIWDGSIGYQLPKRYGVVQLSVTNIFDKDFLYEPTGFDSRLLPKTSINLKVSLNF